MTITNFPNGITVGNVTLDSSGVTFPIMFEINNVGSENEYS